MIIMNRRAEDDFIAMLTAQAVEDEGGQVISIAYNGSDTYQSAIAPHSKFVVFARAQDEEQINRIDKAIAKHLERLPKSRGCAMRTPNSEKAALRYNWLRAQDWTKGSLVITEAFSLGIGAQTYSGERLDSKIDELKGAS